MKYLILILALTLLSCEKETFQEYNLIVSVKNTLPPGEHGTTPQGYTFEYMNQDKLITGSGKYVGETFKMFWNSNMQLYIKIESDHWCEIKVWREGVDLNELDTWRYNKGFKTAIIN